MRSLDSRFVLFAVAAIVVAACSKNTEIHHVGPAPSADGGDAGAGTGSEINTSQLGAACSGFGTGIGQTAAFQTPDCIAGVCLVDAREGLDLYCSADCTNATCPDGWECQTVDNGAPERVCFRTGDASDGGPAATTGFAAPLTGYLGGAKTSTSFPIASFKDPSQLATDLIVLVVAGQWSTFDQKLMEDLETATFTKTFIVSVLADGPVVGKGATKADLTAWHTEFPKHATVLDSDLAVLKSEIGAIGAGPGEIDAFPTLIGLDASTLEEVGREKGYQSIDDLKAMFETWRAKTK